MQNRCAEIKIRAEREGWEMLSETVEQQGRRPSDDRSHDATTFSMRQEANHKTGAALFDRHFQTLLFFIKAA
jgi:hypothetical protein